MLLCCGVLEVLWYCCVAVYLRCCGAVMLWCGDAMMSV